MSRELWRLDDTGSLSLDFHQGQAQAWRSRARFTFVLAGTQGGKTSFGPWWLWREIMNTGGGDHLAVSSSYDLFSLKMLPVMQETFEQNLGIGRYWSSARVIEIKDPTTGTFLASKATDQMWGRIILRSAASGRGLESATARSAWLDECGQDAFSIETWEAVLRRLTLHQGRVLGTTTIYNLGWVKGEVYDRWRAGDRDYKIVSFPSYMNPSFPKAEYRRAKRTMPEWRFRMFYDGQYTRPAGLIYVDFDQEFHQVAPFPIPPHWPRWVGLDFGAVNTALVWLAHDPERDRYYLYRDSLAAEDAAGGKKTTNQHTADALANAAGENVVGWFGGAPSEDQQRLDWGAAGVRVRRPLVADVESGIDKVTALFKGHRLYVFDTCRGTLDELGRYRRKVDEQGNPTEEIDAKATFHRCFVAGTLVTTRRGTIPIERVRPGDWALTRAGYRPVTAAGLSAAAAEVLTVALTDGRTLTGTGDHPIYVDGKGYIPLRALRYGDMLQSSGTPEGGRRWRARRGQGWNGKLSSTRASPSTAIRARAIPPRGGTSRPACNTASAALISCTGRFGRTITAPFRRAMKSITATTTRSTTRPTTWNAKPGPTISPTTPNTSCRSSGHSSASSGSVCGWLRQIGMARMKAGPGTANSGNGPGKAGRRACSRASSVGKPSRPARRMKSAFALRSAGLRPGARLARTMRTALARGVPASSPPTATPKHATAPARVLDVRAAGAEPVYNLTVAGAHEYYANGILVHNCDALRYVVSSLPKEPQRKYSEEDLIL